MAMTDSDIIDDELSRILRLAYMGADRIFRKTRIKTSIMCIELNASSDPTYLEPSNNTNINAPSTAQN